MATHRREFGVRNMFEWVGSSRVFSDGYIIIVDIPLVLVLEDDVLQDTPEFNGVVNIRFLLSGEIDTFSVAAPFDVEDTIIRPTMLVIS